MTNEELTYAFEKHILEGFIKYATVLRDDADCEQRKAYYENVIDFLRRQIKVKNYYLTYAFKINVLEWCIKVATLCRDDADSEQSKAKYENVINFLNRELIVDNYFLQKNGYKSNYNK